MLALLQSIQTSVADGRREVMEAIRLEHMETERHVSEIRMDVNLRLERYSLRLRALERWRDHAVGIGLALTALSGAVGTVLALVWEYIRGRK